MSITRARWSSAEKKAVLDSYNAANDADEFFELVKNALGTAYSRRTVKAYLTFLNDNLVPKTDPRRPVYQSLCDANQKEIAAHKATEDAAKVAAATPVPPVPVVVTPAPAAPDFNWVEREVDVVPRVPPGRVVPPSLFRDPSLPTLNEALAAKAAEYGVTSPPYTPPASLGEMSPETARRFDGATRYAEPVTPPRVTPDPKALVPRHYPALPPKAKFTADELAQVFGLHRTKVVDAFAYGFIQTLDGAHITYQTAQRIHDAMSEGHSFSEACRQVNPNSTGLLPMEALIETPDEQAPVMVPGTEAGKVSLKVGGWTVSASPMNPKSVDTVARDIAQVEVLSGPPSLFQGGEVFPVAKSAEAPSEPAKAVDNDAVTPGGASVKYTESTRIKLNPVNEIPLDEVHAGPPVTVPPVTVPKVQPGTFEQYTLEAVRDGVLTTAQAVDILAPRDTNKAIWALSLLASGKISVVQCDRLIYAKSL